MSTRVVTVTVDGRSVAVPSTDPGRVLNVGPTGEDGADGAPGADGVDGQDGAPGQDGTDGAIGPAGPGLAPGGTTGQIAAKASDNDYDTEWIDPAAGGSAVDSVNAQTGVVVLDAADVGADATGTASAAVATHAGLADPHPGYLTPAEGNAAYDALGDAAAAQAAAEATAAGALSTHAADTTSVHGIADTSVLATDAEVATAVSDHAAAANPHPTYLTQAEGDAAYDAAGAAAAAQAASQPLDTDLSAIAALASAANKLAYATGSGAWSLADFSAFARTLLDDADAATMRATLGVDASGTAVLKSLFDANTMLYATTDDTPVALTVAASRIVGRKATGDIVALTAAELAAILGSGTRDATTFLRGDNTWAVPSGGGAAELLASVSYNPGTAVTLTTTSVFSTAFVDADATNLVITFTAPASGNVLIKFECCANNSGNASTILGLRESTTTLTGSGQVVTNGSAVKRIPASWKRTGLTPGNSYTYKIAFAVVAGTASLFIGGGNANPNGEALIEVWSA